MSNYKRRQNREKENRGQSIWLMLENGIKYFGAFLALCYGLGLLLSNYFLSFRLNTSDFELLKAQFIFTGFSFILYLFIPFFIFVPPLLTFKYFYRQPKGLWLALLITGACFLFGSVLLPLGLHYFFPNTLLVARLAAEKDGILCGYMKIVIYDFWQRYWGPQCIGFLVLLTTAVLLFAKRNLNRSYRVSLFVFQVVSILFLLFYFETNVFSNMSPGFGGGAPETGLITLANNDDFFNTPGLQNPGNAESKSVTFPAVIMHRGREFTYVQTVDAFNAYDPLSGRIIALRTADILRVTPLGVCSFFDKDLAVSLGYINNIYNERILTISATMFVVGKEKGVCTFGPSSCLHHSEILLCTTNRILLRGTSERVSSVTWWNKETTFEYNFTPEPNCSVFDLTSSNLTSELRVIKLCNNLNTNCEVLSATCCLTINGFYRQSFSLLNGLRNEKDVYWLFPGAYPPAISPSTNSLYRPQTQTTSTNSIKFNPNN